MKKSLGVKIIGVLLIVSSLQQMFVLLLETEWYAQMFEFMPQWLIGVRYIFSLGQRIVGISCGIGLLLYKEIFRKLTIALGIFAVLTLYWKHPFAGFMNAADYARDRISEPLAIITAHSSDITLENMVLAAVIITRLLDIIFWACVIFCLTRPNVKTQFS